MCTTLNHQIYCLKNHMILKLWFLSICVWMRSSLQGSHNTSWTHTSFRLGTHDAMRSRRYSQPSTNYQYGCTAPVQAMLWADVAGLKEGSFIQLQQLHPHPFLYDNIDLLRILHLVPAKKGSAPWISIFELLRSAVFSFFYYINTMQQTRTQKEGLHTQKEDVHKENHPCHQATGTATQSLKYMRVDWQ